MINIRRHVFILLHFEIRKLKFKELPKVTELLAIKPKFPNQAWFQSPCVQGHHLLPFKTLLLYSSQPFLPWEKLVGETVNWQDFVLNMLCVSSGILESRTWLSFTIHQPPVRHCSCQEHHEISPSWNIHPSFFLFSHNLWQHLLVLKAPSYPQQNFRVPKLHTEKLSPT